MKGRRAKYRNAVGLLIERGYQLEKNTQLWVYRGNVGWRRFVGVYGKSPFQYMIDEGFNCVNIGPDAIAIFDDVIRQNPEIAIEFIWRDERSRR